MPGEEVENVESFPVVTLSDALNECVQIPHRYPNAPFRMPVSQVFKIKGVGNLVAGCVEQGNIAVDETVLFFPSRREDGKLCEGQISSIEMHHDRLDRALPGDTVAMCIKGLDQSNMPRPGQASATSHDAHTLERVPHFG